MSTSAFKLDPDVVKLEDQLVEDRRWFHAHPELSMQEHKTADFVVARLRAIGVEEVSCTLRPIVQVNQSDRFVNI